MVRHNKAHGSSITLVLQGGAHGAFTWGMLDRLLEQPGCHIAGISATSSGAMNNARHWPGGWQQQGAEGTRASLTAFWETLACRHAASSWWAAAAATLPGHTTHWPTSPRDVQSVAHPGQPVPRPARP